MTDKTSTTPGGPRLAPPDEFLLMGFDTPKRSEVVRCQNPSSPLIPCPSDDPFDLGELAAARENDPFELTAVNRLNQSEPNVDGLKTSEPARETCELPVDLFGCTSQLIAGRKANPNVLRRVLSEADLTGVPSHGPVSSTPLSRATHRALQSTPGRSPISHRLALDDHFVGEDSIIQNEPEGVTLPDFSRTQQEALRISRILESLGDDCPGLAIQEASREARRSRKFYEEYENLVEGDIRLEVAPWDDNSTSLDTVLGENDDIDEFGLPQVRTYSGVSCSKLDVSQEDVDSLLKRYRAHRNSINLDDEVEDSIACNDTGSTTRTEESAQPQCSNSSKIANPQGLTNVPIIHPPPIPENVKIEVKPKSTTVVKRGPMRATMPIPSMLRTGAGACKDESQVVPTGSEAGKTHFPRRDPSPRKMKSPLLRSKTSEVMIVGGSKANISGSGLGLRAPQKKTRPEETLGPKPSKSSGAGFSPGFLKQQPRNIAGSGLRAPLKRTSSEETLRPTPSKSSGAGLSPGFKKQQPSLITSSGANGLKKVLTPVFRQPTKPLVSPYLKKPKPQVPGKENVGAKTKR